VVESVKTILVVEDEPAVKRATVRVLKREGYRVLAASNGEEAVKLSRNHHGKIDLVLCDVIMPGMSGPQAVVHILKRRSDVRVLYMSGYTDEALDRHGVLGDGIPLVHKPFTPQDLISRVKETLVGKTPIPALWDGPRSPSKNH
jgi:CheY-like chemotaxis protein